MDKDDLVDHLKAIAPPKDADIQSGYLAMKTESGKKMQNGYFARFSI